jgi:L-aminopeptidase/D-esterase-like protein
MVQPGPLNALTDVPGVTVGNAQDPVLRSGVTVIRLGGGMLCVADVGGGGPVTRETTSVSTDTTLRGAHAIVFSGGSVYGLAAGDAVTHALAAEGVGYVPVPGTPPVPVVPGAAIYDLDNGGDKTGTGVTPYPELARQALAAAAPEFAIGSAGAGYGAVAGTWRGGLGTASLDLGEGMIVAALAVANPVGSTLMPDGRCFWAWPFEIGAEFGGLRPAADCPSAVGLPQDMKGAALTPTGTLATTLVVVAVSIALERASLKRVAAMAQDGLARAVRPIHAPFDGDSLLAVCPDETVGGPVTVDHNRTLVLGTAAGDCVARAVARGVWEADADWPEFPSVRSRLAPPETPRRAPPATM